jgi:hypothetical protein
MNTTAPKPGPHLHPVPTTPAPVPVFRELAKAHALAAARLLDALPSRPDARDLVILEAQAHALVSAACSAVAPPARRERVSCRAAGGAL